MIANFKGDKTMILNIEELRYKHESNPQYKFITKNHSCSNTECKHFDYIDSCKKFKSCKKSIAYIEVIGLELKLIN